MIRWLVDIYRRYREQKAFEWAHVPPPEWAAKRGWGSNYW